VLGILGSPALKYYFRKQMFEATATTPRPAGMSDDDYFDLCCTSADEHGKTARDKGSDFHTICQEFHKASLEFGAGSALIPKIAETMLRETDPLFPQFTAYAEWYKKNIRRTLMVEQVVVGQGYAGRVDHVAELMDGQIACMDPKTQDTTKKKGKFTFYDQWPIQLAAYAGAIQPVPHCLISIAVSSQEGSAQVEAKIWEKPVDYYHEIFLGLLKFWKHSNDYHPV
jgi:hypothetical protein